MEEIVAVSVKLTNGQVRYFLTWGRIQQNIATEDLEAIVLRHASTFDLGGIPKRARICPTLQKASRQPYFFECFFAMSRKGIPEGRRFGAWKRKVAKAMRRGQELYYLGNSKRDSV